MPITWYVAILSHIPIAMRQDCSGISCHKELPMSWVALLNYVHDCLSPFHHGIWAALQQMTPRQAGFRALRTFPAKLQNFAVIKVCFPHPCKYHETQTFNFILFGLICLAKPHLLFSAAPFLCLFFRARVATKRMCNSGDSRI